MRSATVLLASCLAVIPGMTQVPASFDAASIKPSVVQANGRYGNYRRLGGPGTNDPGRMILENYDLRSLILKAYDLPLYRFSGPEWLYDLRFDVSATMPPDTTKEQFLLMQRDLLARRFGLVVHHEKKEMPIFELVVMKSGNKLKPAVPLPDETEPPKDLFEVKKDGDGFPILTHPSMTMMSTGDRATYRRQDATMEQFASFVENQMQAPVTDATGLRGKYDVTVHWVQASRAADSLLPSFEEALPVQLGLTLRKAKGLVEVLVLDHMEKAPTDN